MLFREAPIVLRLKLNHFPHPGDSSKIPSPGKSRTVHCTTVPYVFPQVLGSEVLGSLLGFQVLGSQVLGSLGSEVLGSQVLGVFYLFFIFYFFYNIDEWLGQGGPGP